MRASLPCCWSPGPDPNRGAPRLVRGSLGAIAITMLVFFAIAVRASAEPLCTDSWAGGAEGNWQEAAKWSAGHVPSSTDVVCIASGQTVNVWSETSHAGVLEAQGTIDMTSSALEVSNTLEASTIAHLDLLGGVLSGPANINLTKSLIAGSNGEISASGTVTITSTASASAESRMYLQSKLVNAGTLNLIGGGGIVGKGSALLVNEGTLNLNSEGINAGLRSEEAGPSLLNTGTLQKTSGAALSEVGFSFINEGTVRGASGGLDFNGGGPGTGTAGTWISEGEGRIVFGGSKTLSLGSSPSLTGAYEVDGPIAAGAIAGAGASLTTAPIGSVVVNGPTTSKLKSLSMNGGVFTSNAPTEITQLLSVEGNGEISGTGGVVVAPGATGEVRPSNYLYLNGLLVNKGSFIEPTSSGIEGYAGAELVNEASFNANGQEYAPFGAHTGLIRVGPGGTAPKLVNRGLFQKTEGTGTTTVQFAVENFGAVIAKVGKFEFETLLNLPNAALYGGSNSPVAEASPHAACSHKPVSCATGNESETQSDFAIGGRGVGLDLTRTYNSQAGAEGTKGVFGYGWSNSFGDHLALEPSNKRATVTLASGATIPFGESGATYTAPAWTQDTLNGGPEAGYTLTTKDQTKYHFAAATGRLETVTDRNANATTLSYGGTGRLEAITDPAGRKITLIYNGEGLVESATDPMGHVVKYTYESENLATVVLPGETEPRWRFKYDGSHQLTELIDGRGGKTTNEYNGAHQLVSQTDPLKQVLSFEYEPFHTKITNHATGSVTDEYFTSIGLPVSVTHGFGTASATTESFSYDSAGNLLSSTDGNGHSTKYTYDGASNRTSVLDPNNNETKWTYDATHDVETTTTPKGETTTIERDSYGNAIKLTRPAPASTTQVTKYKYDAHGELETSGRPTQTRVEIRIRRQRRSQRRNRSRIGQAHVGLQRRLARNLDGESKGRGGRRHQRSQIQDHDRTRRPRARDARDRAAQTRNEIRLRSQRQPGIDHRSRSEQNRLQLRRRQSAYEGRRAKQNGHRNRIRRGWPRDQPNRRQQTHDQIHA